MLDLTFGQVCLAELLLVAVALAAAYLLPNEYGMARLERAAGRLALRPLRCFVALVLFSVSLRLALLPIERVPAPLFHDEFSYMLGADTFAHGRLTNPAPPVPIAFESIHINVSPTYQSMYLPGTALVLAAGKILGSSWIVVMLITALLSGTMYWMSAGWLPRNYALLAGIITATITGNMNWWFDNYFCIAFTSLGTALVLGSLPRLAESRRYRFALALGVGLSFFILTRPYEGCCVTLPCVIALLWRLRRAGARTLGGLGTAACAVPMAAVSWLLYYNWKGTGSALLFPYMLNLAHYHITGPFLFSAKHALPVYDLDILRRFYIFAEISQYDFIHAHPWLFLEKKIAVYYVAVLFGFGLVFCAGLVELIRIRRAGIWLAPLLGLCGLGVNVALMGWSPFPQYIAPGFPLLILLVTLGFAAIRKMNLGRITGVHLTHGLALAEVMFALSLFGYRVSDSRNLPEPQYVSKDRDAVAREVSEYAGKQLCLVRYTEFHESWQEWVFNGADLNGEKVMWARSLNAQTDKAVMAAFPDRRVWLVKPDYARELLSPYDPAATFPLLPPKAVAHE